MPTYQDPRGRAIVHSYIEGSVLDNTLKRDKWTVVSDSQSYVDDDIYQAVPEVNQIPIPVKKISDKQILEEINDNVFDLLETGEGTRSASVVGHANVDTSNVEPDAVDTTTKTTKSTK